MCRSLIKIYTFFIIIYRIMIKIIIYKMIFNVKGEKIKVYKNKFKVIIVLFIFINYTKFIKCMNV